MSSHSKTCVLTFAALLALLALVLRVPAIAQQSADIAQQSADLVSPDQTGTAAASQKATAAQTPSGSRPTSLSQ
jgi:hypothetical protein